MTGVAGGDRTRFPVSAGLLLGVGLGGLFDGIVLHQLLQWHHMVSSWYPVSSIQNLELNTFWDGVFHSATYILVLAGLFILWRSSRLIHFRWSASDLLASILMGFGAFNLVEGIIDHQILGLHHVNETVPRSLWLVWDLCFLAWGGTMVVGGVVLWRRRNG